MSELKPCPHCGSALVVHEVIPGSYEPYNQKHIRCEGCGSESPTPETWNLRAGNQVLTLRFEIDNLLEVVSKLKVLDTP